VHSLEHFAIANNWRERASASDDIPAEVARLEKLGAMVVSRLQRWVVMEAPTGQRFCIVRVQRSGFAKNANRWD